MSVFSNSTEWEIWSSGWCNRCAKDELGGAPEGTWCPIVSNVVAMNDQVPPEWIEGEGINNYSCTQFEEEQ